jgi:hypothetical protein
LSDSSALANKATNAMGFVSMCDCSLAHAKFNQDRNHFLNATLTPPEIAPAAAKRKQPLRITGSQQKGEK